ncbi:cytochrome b [Afifella sp. IM 167]|uniref:cytochrome b n=1 Tax=Afifella sp. IM 167 TaxID=2033586 RepID=UPI001CCB960C|nr:cytochrome b/b6 domain-containing protein [Afifella sp. IM 167]
MQISDTSRGYSPFSVAIHWLAAAAIIAIWLLGNQLEDLPRGPEKAAALQLHMGVAVTLFVVLIGRIVWRLTTTRPERPDEAPALKAVAAIVQWGLLLALTLLVVSGPLMVWSGGHEIPVFGAFTIPGPIGESEGLHEFAEGVHGLAAKAIMILFVLHVLGALKLWITQPKSLRMLQPGR